MHGSRMIGDALTSMFVKTSSILTMSLPKPQTPVEYIQQVLIPEAGILLIQGDLEQKRGQSVDVNIALDVMKESKKYGIEVHP